MAQLNIHMTDDFGKTLARFMKKRGIATKSEAIRVAVREALERATRSPSNVDYAKWLGLGLRVPENPNRRFQTHDELWS